MFEKIFEFIDTCNREIIKLYSVDTLLEFFDYPTSFLFFFVCWYFLIKFKGLKKR